MEKNTRSYNQIFNFTAAAKGYLATNTEETKLKYALERTLESLNSNIKTYQTSLSDIDLEHAFANEKGVVPFTTDPRTGARTYEYTKDGLKAKDKAIEDLFQSKVEVSVHYATDLPENLLEGYKEVFAGFVIKEDTKLKKA